MPLVQELLRFDYETSCRWNQEGVNYPWTGDYSCTVANIAVRHGTQ